MITKENLWEFQDLNKFLITKKWFHLKMIFNIFLHQIGFKLLVMIHKKLMFIYMFIDNEEKDWNSFG